jgi:hypothetical protein
VSNLDKLRQIKQIEGFMIINCKSCNSKNKVIEIVTLKDSELCENRLIFKGFCAKCKQEIAVYLEIRKDDKKAFFKKKNNFELKALIKKEKRNIISFDKYNNCGSGWRYGINKEIRNKTGKVLKIRQYGADYKTNKTELEKEICIV